jgi:regulator of sigma D
MLSRLIQFDARYFNAKKEINLAINLSTWAPKLTPMCPCYCVQERKELYIWTQTFKDYISKGHFLVLVFLAHFLDNQQPVIKFD